MARDLGAKTHLDRDGVLACKRARAPKSKQLRRAFLFERLLLSRSLARPFCTLGAPSNATGPAGAKRIHVKLSLEIRRARWAHAGNKAGRQAGGLAGGQVARVRQPIATKRSHCFAFFRQQIPASD